MNANIHYCAKFFIIGPKYYICTLYLEPSVLSSLNLPVRLLHDTPPIGFEDRNAECAQQCIREYARNMQETCKIAGFCKVTQERKEAGMKGNGVDGFSTKPSNFDLSSAVTPYL